MRFRPTILLCGTLVLSCALAALIVSSTEAQDKTYTFTKQMKAGDKWTVNTTLRSDMDFVVKDVHGDRDKFSVSAERTETYSSECVEMQSGEISKRRLQYSVSDELVSRSPGEGGEKKKTALSGKSIDVETGQDGTKVTCVEGEIPADATAGLRAEEDYALLLPKKAVKESDTWELESEDAGNFAFGLDKKIVTPRNIGEVHTARGHKAGLARHRKDRDRRQAGWNDAGRLLRATGTHRRTPLLHGRGTPCFHVA
jgi:hypothetical protein